MDVQQAQDAIAAILHKLEKDTGSFVRSLSIEDVETTTFSSEERTVQTRVNIDIDRRTHRHWNGV